MKNLDDKERINVAIKAGGRKGILEDTEESLSSLADSMGGPEVFVLATIGLAVLLIVIYNIYLGFL